MNTIYFFIKLAFLAGKRFRSEQAYVEFQKHQAAGIYKNIVNILKVDKRCFVIDYGCGKGGYTYYLAKKFSEILAVDYYVKPLKIKNIRFEQHDLMSFKSRKKADFIFCASVIEHINKQDIFIKRIKSNLNKGGVLYLSFPPFYSINGGHQIKPFHYLPENLAILIAKIFKKINHSVTGYNNLFGDWGLYKTSINDIKRLLIKNDFEIIEYKPRFLSGSFPFNTAKYPILNNFLTWHVEFYVKKNEK
jgi:SAM-dependent methyltransferase